MVDQTNGKHVQRKMLTRRRNSLAAMFVALGVVASAYGPARADDRTRIEGAFSVLYAYPSAVNYCRDPGDDRVSIQAQGLGNIPGLGAMVMTVKKCYDFTDGTYAGSFTMSAGTGDALNGTYEGTQGSYDENGFSPFWGVLTITRGTGRFRNATGQLRFEATSGPDSVGAIAGTFNGTAFYLVRGTVSLGNR